MCLPLDLSNPIKAIMKSVPLNELTACWRKKSQSRQSCLLPLLSDQSQEKEERVSVFLASMFLFENQASDFFFHNLKSCLTLRALEFLDYDCVLVCVCFKCQESL